MAELKPQVLLTGATGFIGGRLLQALTEEGFHVRVLVRSKGRLRSPLDNNPGVEVFEGDLLKRESILSAMDGTDAAFYLVHSMGGRNLSEIKSFAERDKRAAENFVWAADRVGLARIIYLGGMGEMGDNLSEHLVSRQQVGQILSSGKARATILRAANIIGAGGAPFEMLRHLTERLPVMLCPRWIETRAQPIAVQNVIEYLMGCLKSRETAGRSLDIGGPDILSYRELMFIYARARGLRRVVITVPVLTPRLSSLLDQPGHASAGGSRNAASGRVEERGRMSRQPDSGSHSHASHPHGGSHLYGLGRGSRRAWKTAFGAGVFPAMKSSAFHPPDPPFFNFHNEVGANADGEDSSP